MRIREGKFRTSIRLPHFINTYRKVRQQSRGGYAFAVKSALFEISLGELDESVRLICESEIVFFGPQPLEG